MKLINIVIAILLLMTIAPAARADEPDAVAPPTDALGTVGPWAADASTAWLVMGPRAHQTGGLVVSAAVTRTIALSERVGLAVGGELSCFGMDAGSRWMGVLGGATARLRLQSAWRSVSVGVGAHLDGGRIPIINAWGLPLNYAGFFPSGSAFLGYAPSPRVSFDASGAVMVVETLGYKGPGGRFGIAGIVRF